MVDSPGHEVAGTTLLETKLYVPRWRSDLVSRPRLIERVQQGIDRKLTLVSAPAGFGKTTLLAEWLAIHASDRAGWVSLDRADNAPALFWTYFISALQQIQPDVGKHALVLLLSPQSPPMESVLTTLINEISTIEANFILLLDDYHVIESPPIHNALGFLLDHLPPQLHLIIASRSDPPLPLARLRARSESTELRAADLRFTPTEAAVFLNQAMGLELTADYVATLEARTEGWIAGLQLAALSMQGRADIAGFIRAFSGDDRYVVDYLVAEVLQRQPEGVRSFLLQTSILDRLSSPLCDAVTEQQESKTLLGTLERGNLFVVPLDDKRQWYRHHHLFADVLHAHLLEEQPERVPELHRRASEWYEHNGLPAEAIHHALAGEDVERAADLLELTWPAMRMSRREATMLGWISALPDELIRARPVLSVAYALALLAESELAAAEPRLRDAERWLDAASDTGARPKKTPTPEMVVVDETQFRSLPAIIANARAYRAQAMGDVSETVMYARQALGLLREDDHYERGTTAALLGLAHWTSGNLEEAHLSFADGLASLRLAGGIPIVIGGTVILAHVRIAQGRLHEAVRAYEQSLQLAMEQEEHTPGTAELYMGLGELYLERGDLEAARQYLRTGETLGDQASLPGFEHLWCIVRARLKEVEGDMDGALDLLQEAERLYYRSPVPNVRPIAALKARVWLRQGRLAEALSWVRERALSVDDELSYLHEYEHTTLVKVLIALYRTDRAEHSIDEVIGLLERLLKAAEKGNRTGTVVEVLTLQALAYEAQGDTDATLAPLERALSLAEPEDYVRVFVDEGEAMRDLLRQAMANEMSGSYTRRLLVAFDESTAPEGVQDTTAGLVKALTRREAEILRLIAAGMRNQEIADQLFISLATVKRHVANVYSKLGVTHRTEAISRATELKLL